MKEIQFKNFTVFLYSCIPVFSISYSSQVKNRTNHGVRRTNMGAFGTNMGAYWTNMGALGNTLESIKKTKTAFLAQKLGKTVFAHFFLRNFGPDTV